MNFMPADSRGIATCVNVGVYAHALTYGDEYAILARDTDKDQVTAPPTIHSTGFTALTSCWNFPTANGDGAITLGTIEQSLAFIESHGEMMDCSLPVV